MENVPVELPLSIFPDKAQEPNNTNPMSLEATTSFCSLVMFDQRNRQTVKDINELKADHSCELILKRIEAFKLPISFTPNALFALSLLAEGVPGMLVIGLIDSLTKFEGQEVSFNDIVKLYPFGMYNADVGRDYIDNYLKPRAVKWSFVYASN